jgi:hypothetical protein
MFGWAEQWTDETARIDPADGALVIRPGGSPTYLTFEGLFTGRRFQVEATVEPPKQGRGYTAGMTCGSSDPFNVHGVWMTVAPDVHVLNNNWNPNLRSPFTPAAANEFRMTVFDDQLHVEVDGKKAFVMNQLSFYLGVPKLYVGLVASTDPPGGEVKFRKLRIRTVDQPPEN